MHWDVRTISDLAIEMFLAIIEFSEEAVRYESLWIQHELSLNNIKWQFHCLVSDAVGKCALTIYQKT